MCCGNTNCLSFYCYLIKYKNLFNYFWIWCVYYVCLISLGLWNTCPIVPCSLLLIRLLLLIVVDLMIIPRKVCPCPNFQNPWMLYYLEKDYLWYNYFDWKVHPWIIQDGHKFNNKSFVRQTLGELTLTEKEEVVWRWRCQSGWCSQETVKARKHQNLRVISNGIPLEPSEKARPSRHLKYGLLTSRTTRLDSCCVKPLTGWPFVIAPPGNKDFEIDNLSYYLKLHDPVE